MDPHLHLEDIPALGSRRVERASGLDVAVFRNSQDEVFALLDRCPHKGGPLSQGIVFGTSVACPLHNWTIGLCDGQASAPDEGCTPNSASSWRTAWCTWMPLSCKVTRHRSGAPHRRAERSTTVVTADPVPGPRARCSRSLSHGTGETRSTCPYCGVGCGVIIQSTGNQITGVKGDPQHPANFGRLCSKGSTLHLTATADVTLQTRLLQPLQRLQRGAAPEPVTWDSALHTATTNFAASHP